MVYIDMNFIHPICVLNDESFVKLGWWIIYKWSRLVIVCNTFASFPHPPIISFARFAALFKVCGWKQEMPCYDGWTLLIPKLWKNYLIYTIICFFSVISKEAIRVVQIVPVLPCSYIYLLWSLLRYCWYFFLGQVSSTLLSCHFKGNWNAYKNTYIMFALSA